MKFHSTFAFLLLLVLGCAEQNKTPIDEENKFFSSKNSWVISSNNEWLTNHGLTNVESIIYDETNQVFYTTNGVNYELGTSGFVSRISKTGELQELKWVSELNRPTGMAIYDSLLYIADVNALVVVNTQNGQIINKYKEPIPNSGLNDVAINKQGEVYISASFVHSIFKLKDGQLNLLTQDEEHLKWANGVTFRDNQLIVAGLNLSILDLESMKITPIQLDPPIKDFDGIVPDGEDGYFLTTVENSALFHVNKERKVSKLLSEDIYFGDLAISKNSRNLYIPRGNKKTNEFYITVLSIDKYANQ